MADAGTITLPRAEYNALIARNEELEDRLAALEADDGSRIPHDVALAIMPAKTPWLHCAIISGSRCAT